MNQDFAVLATPANARRLRLLQSVCNLTLTDEIERLALTDRVDPTSAFRPLNFPPTAELLTITQFLLDCNLRGVVQADYHPQMTVVATLNAVRLAQPERIVVITERQVVWSLAMQALHLNNMRVFTTIKSLSSLDRQTVVIYDTRNTDITITAALRNLVREFPRFLVFEDQRGFDWLTHWTLWARLLFPAMPYPLYPRLVADLPAGWEDHPLVDFALFYNVCIFPEIITSPQIIRVLGDHYAKSRSRFAGQF